MSATTTTPSRSILMQVLRASPVPILLSWVAGVVLMGASLTSSAEQQLLWDVGYHVLILGGLSFVVVLWGGVYLEVVEASRGMPGLRSVGAPEMKSEVATELMSLEQSLSALGFRHDGWFSLDDFAEMHVSAWRHENHPTVAFLLYFPAGEVFRLRFVRQFTSGGILVSSTRVIDSATPPPEGIYIQVRKGASASELWAWHLEAETLFPDATTAAPGANEPDAPKDLYVAVSARWAKHLRRDRTWLLAVEPVGECWRIYNLRGMPLQRQFELGWATPYWR